MSSASGAPTVAAPSARFGVLGTKTAEFCSGHAKDGMVNIMSERWNHRGCTKHAKVCVAGAKKAEFCSGRTKGEIVQVVNDGCAQPGCTTLPNFGVTGSTQTFSVRHAGEGMA
ncbi:unnamed protein product, partial [Pylaiella littoralis]